MVHCLSLACRLAVRCRSSSSSSFSLTSVPVAVPVWDYHTATAVLFRAFAFISHCPLLQMDLAARQMLSYAEAVSSTAPPTGRGLALAG